MKKIVFLVSALIFATVAFAQTDFSGTWKLNSSKSKLGERSFAPKELVITQTGNDLNIESHSQFQDREMTRTNKYTLDGKECVNAGFRDTEVKSTAVWSDDKKVLTISSKFPMQNGEMKMTAVYKIDGESLVVESSSSSSFGDRSETQIFDKQ